MNIDKFISHRVRKLVESKTLSSLSSLSSNNFINLGIGEPDFNTPPNIIDSAKKSLDNGYTHYTSSRGIRELREAIADKLRRENNLDVDSENIIVTPGSKYAIYATLLTILNNGDEVLIPEPYWVSYKEMVKLAGGIAHIVPTNSEFKLTRDILSKHISIRSKAIIINSPNNPSGAIYTYDELKEIADIIIESNLLVISDEIYEKIVYDGMRHISIASLNEMSDRVITVNGFSKAYAMTGWRIGYAAAPKEITREINKILQHSITCIPEFIQKAALTALTDKETDYYVNKIISEFRRRRDFITKELRRIGFFKFEKPHATFYLFPEIKDKTINALDFTNLLYEKGKVIVIPGNAFGDYKFNIRISYATSMKHLEEAIKRIENIVSELRDGYI